MRKIISLILILLSVNSIGIAQDNKLNLEAYFGASYPLGLYSSTTDAGGYALLGSFISLKYLYNFSDNIGVGFKFINCNNSIDDKAMEIQLSKEAMYLIDVKTTNYTTNALLFGLNYKTPIGDKFTINTQIMAGILDHVIPEMELCNVSNPESSNAFKANSSYTFGFDLSTSLTYNINPRWNLSLNIGYTTGYFKYNNAIVEFKNLEWPREDFDQKVGLLSTSLSVGFNF